MKPTFVFSFLFLVLFLPIHGTQFPSSTCWDHDSDCPCCPDPDYQYCFTSFFYLSFHFEFVQQVHKAQIIIEAEDPANVLSLEPLVALHTSLNYFCCHSEAEKNIIITTLHNFTWNPFELTYDNYACNIDHNNKTVYLTALLSDESETFLMNFTKHIETLIIEAGVPIHHPRIQKFHNTQARVTEQYPSDDIISILRNFNFGTVSIDKFFLGDHIFKAI